MDVTNKAPLRLRAAGWTAAVAVIPAYASAYVVHEVLTQSDYFHLAGLPVMTAMAVVAAGISGYFLCWTLFDYERQHNGLESAEVGVATCMVAYVIFGCMAAVEWLWRMPLPDQRWVSGYDNLVSHFGILVIAMYFVALMSTFLITVPTAAFAAFMISLTYRDGG